MSLQKYKFQVMIGSLEDGTWQWQERTFFSQVI